MFTKLYCLLYVAVNQFHLSHVFPHDFLRRGAKVKDFYVQRYPGAVSWFSPGSFGLRPPLQLKDISNCVCAGKQDALLSYSFAHMICCDYDSREVEWNCNLLFADSNFSNR
jgi:hypothetical protein